MKVSLVWNVTPGQASFLGMRAVESVARGCTEEGAGWDLHSDPDSSPLDLDHQARLLVRLLVPKAWAASPRVVGSESEAGPGLQPLALEVWTQGSSNGQRAGCSEGRAGAEPGPLAQALPQVPPLPAEYPGGAGGAGKTGSSRLSA